MIRLSVDCDYCGKPALLVSGSVIYPHRQDLDEKKFWYCKPCQAWVGAHYNSEDHAPLGRLAKKELRTLKRKVHGIFDPIWQEGHQNRRKLYQWLSKKMGIKESQCHVGMFSEDQCRKAYKTISENIGELRGENG